MGLSVLAQVTTSSLVLQFHRMHCRDSAPNHTPFVRVGTYPTRNFATLGPFITAAVYWGLNSGFAGLTSLTFQRRAGVSPYTSPFGSRMLDLCFCQTVAWSLFSAAPALRGHPSSKFTESFVEFLNNASSVGLRISLLIHLSVYGMGMCITIAAFLAHGSHASLLWFQSTLRLRIVRKICCPTPAPRLYRFFSRLMLSTCVPTVLGTHSGNLHLLSIDYVFRPRLRAPTYPEQISFTWKPWIFGREGFSPSSRYSFQHSLFLALHCSLSVQLRCANNAPLPLLNGVQASVSCFAWTFFYRPLTSELLRLL